MRYDVVVVGSGSAGAVVARRLVDAGASVLVLEAGGPDESPAVHDPARLFELWGATEDWDYPTVPQRGCNGRVLRLPRGRVLGGSSALNGMIYVRGHRSDYDAWAGHGNPGWSYDDVLPLFRRSEDFDRGASDYHGKGGPLRVISEYEPHPVSAATVIAAQEAGIAFNDDCNGPEQDGVGFAQLTIKDGRRHSASEAFLRPVREAENLTVWTRTRALRLLLEGSRCVGVEVVRDGVVEAVRVEHEVVVSCGAFESPRLLMLSGIGDGPELSRLGIDVRAELRGVGANLHDHALSPVIYSAAKPVPPPVPGLQAFHTHLFWRSRPGLTGPDVQPIFFHLPMYLPEAGMEGPDDGYTLMAGIIRPGSSGSVRLTSADPAAELAIDPGYMNRDADVETMADAIELCREIGRQPGLAEWRAAELYPGESVRTRAEVRDYVRATTITYHHPVGTCRMGVDELAVVDPELRVIGVDGLRVADASIMPQITSGNTHAPAVMIGERAADLVASAIAGRAIEATHA